MFSYPEPATWRFIAWWVHVPQCREEEVPRTQLGVENLLLWSPVCQWGLLVVYWWPGTPKVWTWHFKGGISPSEIRKIQSPCSAFLLTLRTFVLSRISFILFTFIQPLTDSRYQFRIVTASLELDGKEFYIAFHTSWGSLPVARYTY